MIVSKFGGSCLNTKHAIKNIIKLSKSPQRRVLVFSAIGKFSPQDTKLTDLLISLYNTDNSYEYDKINSQILQKLKTFLQYLGLTIDPTKDWNKCLATFKATQSYNYLVSRGEYLTTLYMSKALNIPFVPAEDLIVINNGKPCYKQISSTLTELLKQHNQISTSGFYGVDVNGKIELFERGGSDITGAIISKIVHADFYENWKDVPCLKQLNPNIIRTSKNIYNISYDELKFMVNYDTNVLHKSCCKILNQTNIATKICYINKPNSKPTLITNTPSNNNFVVYKIKNGLYHFIVKNSGVITKFQTPKTQAHKLIKLVYKKFVNT